MLATHVINVLPMMNPDGVVLGNARASLAGCDLNRRWGEPDQKLHPELFNLKQMMMSAPSESAGILMFLDLHGHNKDTDCFFYGCNKAPNEGLLSWTKTRVLPKIMASYEPILDFQKCKFS